jgi:hypothetical protein
LDTMNILTGDRVYLNGLGNTDLPKLMKWQLKEPLMRQFDATPLTPKREDELKSG